MGTGTGTGSGGSGSGGAGSGGTGGAASSRTPIERFCAAHCSPDLDVNCSTKPLSICYAALSTEANLEKLEVCATQGKCSPTACGLGSSAALTLLKKCQVKVESCGGSLGGFNAPDCDDVMPLFREDVIDALSTCFEEVCDAIQPCMLSTVQSKESAACSGL